jgi:hypothetical protein
MNIFKEFKYMLSSDGSDKFSSKRVITFLSFLIIASAAITNLVGGVVMNSSMFDGIIMLVMTGLGVTVGEHLLKKKNGEDPNTKKLEPGISIKPKVNEVNEDELGDN